MSQAGKPRRGTLLIAAANLTDDNFNRSVVLLCEHDDSRGSFGLVLNRPLPWKLAEIIEGLDKLDVPLWQGGPVQPNTLHFLHRRADLGVESVEVVPGVWWGGDFEALRECLHAGKIEPAECRFFLGYSGWGENQLAGEMERGSWYLCPASPDIVFASDRGNLWRQVLRTMGPDYAMLSLFPDHPRFN